MSDKITLIGDKDLGHVLGAVRQLGAEDALALDKLVDDTGLPLRKGFPASVLSFPFPRDHLKTWAATTEAVLTEPWAFAVMDGVPQQLTQALSAVTLKQEVVSFTLATEAKVKAFLRSHNDSKPVVWGGLKLQAGTRVIPATMDASSSYDVLLLAEGHLPYLAANLKVTQ